MADFCPRGGNGPTTAAVQRSVLISDVTECTGNVKLMRECCFTGVTEECISVFSGHFVTIH